MPQQRQTQGLYTEADVQLAILDLQRKQIKSIRLAEEVYEVPQTTIRRRRDRTRSRRDCEPIVQRILEECLRGIPPSKAHVRDMADRLLRERSEKPTGKNWVDNFIKRTPELRTRWSRPYDHQRAACEDLAVIRPWFTLVQSMKAKYGIVDEDI
jgi:hypothetical protein